MVLHSLGTLVQVCDRREILRKLLTVIAARSAELEATTLRDLKHLMAENLAPFSQCLHRQVPDQYRVRHWRERCLAIHYVTLSPDRIIFQTVGLPSFAGAPLLHNPHTVQSTRQCLNAEACIPLVCALLAISRAALQLASEAIPMPSNAEFQMPQTSECRA